MGEDRSVTPAHWARHVEPMPWKDDNREPLARWPELQWTETPRSMLASPWFYGAFMFGAGVFFGVGVIVGVML